MFMALRYLAGMGRNSRSRRFLRFVTYVGTGGVAVGVCALVLALSITRGFSREIQGKIVEYGAHVQVENMQDQPLGGADTLAGRLSSYPDVEKVHPVVQELALLRAKGEIDGVGIWGTSDDNDLLQKHTREGSFSLEADDSGRPALILSTRLARLLGTNVGALVTAFSLTGPASGTENGIGRLYARPRVKQFRVAGIYETGLVEFDELYAFTDLETARSLFGYGADQVSRFDLVLHDITRADAFSFELEFELGFPILARSVFQVYKNLFDWIDLQESIIPLVISVIVIVAAMNIIGILLMMVLEKTREIGILRGMGASARTVRRLFQGLGTLIGLVGVLVGEGIALALALLQIRFQLIPVPEETYYMSTAPVALDWVDFLLVAAVTLPLCMLAAYIPARVAAQTDPVRTIRFAS